MAKLDNRYTLIRYVIDAPIVGIGYLLSVKSTLSQVPDDAVIPDFLLTGLALLVWYMAASFSRLYTDRRSNKYSEEIIFIIYTLIIYTIFLSSVFFFLRNYVRFNAGFFGFFLGFLFVFLSLTKYIVRKYLHAAIYKGQLFDNLLIVGATPAALEFYETINKYYYYGYKCIGFVDNQQKKMNGCPYFGNTQSLANILKSQKVDEVIIALPNHENAQIQDCIEVCDYLKVKARILPDMQQYSTSAIQVNNIGQLSVMNIRALPLDKLENKILKQAFDIFFALLFFVFIGSWLMPLIALAIKLSSKGPIIFKQERWGLNNEKIICYKFRTMMAESEDIGPNGEYNQATLNDPRITRLGLFLRKSNLDELPQFWNVLLGNMSTVGPRPHPTPLNIQVMHTVDNYMLRHIVKPGITGWAQVNGCRGETREPGSMQRRVNFDLYYIHRWTFWLDCQIILQTIINIFRGDQNAY
ncbi:MAG: undecaprenyl-phosphate glucose phosphotransferase [Sediminibacterium sp.]|uniref:undecaprenyl-phosphate glucose phosphotransferase n=1 Tax=Sediminibacterium sp. TaxID=1917865 RepID=UPI002719CD0D|nr:undecaprenyl-phosphate glucose phosphotransferase [Sediminibacterium sp.]MDO8997126.1 undecaprenyl-phosphate glucose phosphotransferase [Sediminibacterium sp.]